MTDPSLITHGPDGDRPRIPRPDGMHHARFGRLVRLHERLLQALERLPQRPLDPTTRKRIATQLSNRVSRLRRTLGVRLPQPPVKDRYRIGEAARVVGVSVKTLTRWGQAGRVRWVRPPHDSRYFPRAELVRLIRSLKG